MESFTRSNLFMILRKTKFDSYGNEIQHNIQIIRNNNIYYKNKKGDVKFIDGDSGDMFNLHVQELFIHAKKVKGEGLTPFPERVHQADHKQGEDYRLDRCSVGHGCSLDRQ